MTDLLVTAQMFAIARAGPGAQKSRRVSHICNTKPSIWDHFRCLPRQVGFVEEDKWWAMFALLVAQDRWISALAVWMCMDFKIFCKLAFFSLKRLIFFYLEDRITERKRQREILHLLVHSLNGSHCQSWASQKFFLGLSHGSRCPRTSAILCCFHRPQEGS